MFNKYIKLMELERERIATGKEIEEKRKISTRSNDFYKKYVNNYVFDNVINWGTVGDTFKAFYEGKISTDDARKYLIRAFKDKTRVKEFLTIAEVLLNYENAVSAVEEAELKLDEVEHKIRMLVDKG